MSLYNTVTKIKYKGNSDDLVTLDEYAVFQDDKAKRKYIVFKFVNNVTQQLLGMQFEVCQYNVDGQLIEKSVVVYNKFLAGAEEVFVPKAKLRVSFKCQTISVRLIQAAFDRFIWKEGEYEDNSYKFEHFFHDEKLMEEDAEKGGKKSRKSKEAKKAEKTKKKAGKKKKGNPFVMKDATKKNFAKFPKIFNVLIFILVLGFVIGSVMLFKNDSKLFTEGDYKLRIVSGNDVAIYGYTGTETELVIPETIGSYTVIKIDTGAFKNSDITSLQIDCELTISAKAFENCSKLTSVYSREILVVRTEAFYNCDNLTSVRLSNSYVEKGAINGK